MFKLTISTENEAFADGNRGYEVARILRKLAGEVENSAEAGDYGTVRDFNGNKVGDWKINGQ